MDPIFRAHANPGDPMAASGPAPMAISRTQMRQRYLMAEKEVPKRLERDTSH